MKIWKILSHYVETCRDLSDYSDVKSVGIDETAARRGRDYVTLFVDLRAEKALYVAEGRSSDAIEAFAQDLESHKGKAENIGEISCDLSPAFIKGVEEHLPEAEKTFDKFHVVKLINEAVDEVRKAEQASNPLLKHSRYVFLKNREKYTLKQREKNEELRMSKTKLKTFKACRYGKLFRTCTISRIPPTLR